jgi:PhoH-like ATPase
MFAMDLLMDPNVEIVSLVGIAGSGKTLEATASGLEQVIGDTSIEEMASGYYRKKSDSLYKKLIITRPVQPMGKDIGFLPGNLNEKMLPWLAPIQDQLRFLTGDDQMTLEHYMKSGAIEIEALTYIRGRSIANAFIIVDESQNLTSHEIKTIISRVGEGSKIVLTGDIEQIDNVYVDAYSSGLSHAVEKLKPFELSGHITLKKGERSRVATLASKVL